jgi:hypothetical protein
MLVVAVMAAVGGGGGLGPTTNQMGGFLGLEK